VIGRALCAVLGHRFEPARRTAPMVIPTVGLVMPWEVCERHESRGMGCTRCGRYDEHSWVQDARDVVGREP
jgi:hypothetical protein